MSTSPPLAIAGLAAGLTALGLVVSCEGDDDSPAAVPESRSVGEPLEAVSRLLRLVDEPPVSVAAPGVRSDPDVGPPPRVLVEEPFDTAEAWSPRERAGPLSTSPRGVSLAPGQERWLRLVDPGPSRDLRVEVRWHGGPEESPPIGGPLRLAELSNAPLDAGAVAATQLRRTVGLRTLAATEVHAASRDVRLDHRTQRLGLVLANPFDEPIVVESVRVTELRGGERLALTHDRLEARTPVGTGPVARRLAIGRASCEGLIAATPSRIGYALPSSGTSDAALSFSYGVLRDEFGRGDLDVRFRVRLDGTTIFEETLEHARSATERGPFYRRLELGRLGGEAEIVFETEIVCEPDKHGGAAALAALDPLVLVAWGHPAVRIGASPQRRGLVVVSLDTLRADRVGCYGDSRGLTPTLDALAMESTRFERATAHASFTLPSHASVFSGQYPSVHGVQKPGLHRDRAVTRWLAEMARAAGYRTAAFTGGGQLAPDFGMADGFEVYQWRDALLRGGFDEIEAFLDAAGDEPMLLFLHTYAAHHYEPPREILDAVHPPCGSALHERDSLRDYVVVAREQQLDDVDRAHIAGVYDACVRFADRQLGMAVALLRARGVLERDPMIVFSDHGEELFEHGQVGHGFRAPFQEQVCVPLLVRAAGGGAPQVVSRVVELVDVLPTALELLGQSAPPMIQGESLLPLLEGAAEPGGVAWSEAASGRYAALQGRDWKAMFLRKVGEEEGRVYVFDLENDPGEHTTVAEDHPIHADAVRRFVDTRGRITALVEALDAQVKESGFDWSEIRELMEMGYLEFDSALVDESAREGEGE